MSNVNNRKGGRKVSNNPSKRKSRSCNTERPNKDEQYGKVSKGIDNDVSWYAKNPEMMKAAGSIGFSYPTGTQLDMVATPTIPGLLTLTWKPSFGGKNIAALNQAADSIYSFTVHANSRNTSYSAKDEMILIIAGAQVYSFISYVIRAYGVMKSYSEQNLYMPQTLITAMGLDFDDLQSNLSNMWFDINNMIARCAQIWIPNTLPFITRWFWMNSSVYTDSTSVKAQMYMFVPGAFLAYDDHSFETGGALVPLLYNAGTEEQPAWDKFNPGSVGRTSNLAKYKWKDVLSAFDNLITPLMNSTDRGIIFGDILKAYGTDKIYGLNEIPVDYKVMPAYNAEVLTQIHNAIVVPTKHTIGLYQNMDKNILESLYFDTSTAGPGVVHCLSKTVLDFNQPENPTPEQIMVATRLHVNGIYPRDVMSSEHSSTTGEWTAAERKTSVAIPFSTGTEFIDECCVWDFARGSSTPDNIETREIVCVNSPGNYASNIVALTAFEWAPLVYIGYSTSGMEQQTYGFYGNIDNMCIVSQHDIHKTHMCAVYSEFDVPSI